MAGEPLFLIQINKNESFDLEDRHNAPTASVGVGNLACADGARTAVPIAVQCAIACDVDRDTAWGSAGSVPAFAPRLVGGSGLSDSNFVGLPGYALVGTL